MSILLSTVVYFLYHLVITLPLFTSRRYTVLSLSLSSGAVPKLKSRTALVCVGTLRVTLKNRQN